MSDDPGHVPPPASPPSPPGVSEIINAPLTDPAVAAQRMEDLKADPEFMKRVEAKDAVAFSEYNKAWRVAHGLPAEPAPPYSAAHIEPEADARLAAALEQHAGFYRDRGYSDLQQIEIIGQRPITPEEKRWHEQQWKEKSNSPAFMARWNAREADAIREMNNHAVAMRLPTGTLDDIKRWEGS